MSKLHYARLIYDAAVTATGNGDAVEVPVHESGETALALVVANSTITTMDIDVETSPDGVNWFSFDTFTQATGDTTELDQLTAARFNLLRVRITGFSGTTADVKVYAM